MQVETIIYSPYLYATVTAAGLGLWLWFVWTNLDEPQRRCVKVTAIVCGLLAAAAGWQGYQMGYGANVGKYKFLTYIDGASLEIAKDMQAMCDERDICKPEEIRKRWEDSTGVGKVMAELR
jgi:hypothetical protein